MAERGEFTTWSPIDFWSGCSRKQKLVLVGCDIHAASWRIDHAIEEMNKEMKGVQQQRTREIRSCYVESFEYSLLLTFRHLTHRQK
nr:hypothetical protein CFP56_79105 [Quercus suber]